MIFSINLQTEHSYLLQNNLKLDQMLQFLSKSLKDSDAYFWYKI